MWNHAAGVAVTYVRGPSEGREYVKEWGNSLFIEMQRIHEKNLEPGIIFLNNILNKLGLKYDRV